MRKKERKKSRVERNEDKFYGHELLREFTAVKPRTINQNKYHQSILSNTITIATGLAGTGKTLLALSAGLDLINKNPDIYYKIIIIRPYIPSQFGEKLGALPGELKEKVGPFVESIKDNLRKVLPESRINYVNDKLIEFTVLSLCRGRSFSNAIVIVEEAQNVPKIGDGMKMLLTRIGEDCKLIISGDLDQCDIPYHSSGLKDAIERIEDLSGVGIIDMSDYQDIQRNPIVREILKRYRND